MFHHRHHQLPLSTFVVDSFVDSNVGSCWVMLGHHVGFMASLCFNIRWCRPGRPPFSTADAASCRAWSRRGQVWQIWRAEMKFAVTQLILNNRKGWCDWCVQDSQYHTTWINMVSCFDIMQNFNKLHLTLIWHSDISHRWSSDMVRRHSWPCQEMLLSGRCHTTWLDQLWNWEQQPVGRGLGLVLGTTTCPIRAIL